MQVTGKVLLQREVDAVLFNYPHAKKLYFMTISNEPQATGLLEVFTFNQNSTPIRVQVINNEPWFVAKDVCDVLGISKYRDAIARLDDDEGCPIEVDTLGGMQKMAAVNESGLYTLILQSRKPEAKPFRKWVTSEVLPSIRKKGYYGIKKQANNYLDARDIPYTKQLFNGCEIRTITIEGKQWLSMNDFHRAIGSSTESSQAAKKLNAKEVNAQKIHIFGNTHPSWFITMTGAMLLLSCSRKMQNMRQLELQFSEL
ncbi:BRO family, N-terminal domain protein [Bacteroides caccae ATCC 43185]|nr:BRO family, N-terminal domain protein [Bacteroides caccae ATCC 43185]